MIKQYVVARSDGGGFLAGIDPKGQPVFVADLEKATKMQEFEARLQAGNLAENHGLLAYAGLVVVNVSVLPVSVSYGI